MNLLNSSPGYSSKSGNGLIGVEWSVDCELEIEGLPLEVVVLLNINGTMEDWGEDINEHEHWHQWEEKSNPISSKTDIKHTISLESGE